MRKKLFAGEFISKYLLKLYSLNNFLIFFDCVSVTHFSAKIRLMPLALGNVIKCWFNFACIYLLNDNSADLCWFFLCNSFGPVVPRPQ